VEPTRMVPGKFHAARQRIPPGALALAIGSSVATETRDGSTPSCGEDERRRRILFKHGAGVRRRPAGARGRRRLMGAGSWRSSASPP
jgi:hypothetical protein